VPGRPADTITLEDVLAAFRATDVELASGATSPALQALVTDLDEERKRRIQGVTIGDLMPDTEGTVVSAPVAPEPSPR
jgi:hypothetical protein